MQPRKSAAAITSAATRASGQSTHAYQGTFTSVGGSNPGGTVGSGDGSTSSMRAILADPRLRVNDGPQPTAS